jgi:hypothetical protein
MSVRSFMKDPTMIGVHILLTLFGILLLGLVSLGLLWAL